MYVTKGNSSFKACILFVIAILPFKFAHAIHVNDSSISHSVSVNEKYVDSGDSVVSASIGRVSQSTDTLIRVIRDSIDRITTNTKPQRLFGADATKTSGVIALCAMIFGFFAMVFGLLGFIYQKKSAKSLKQIEAKRIPFLILAKKIYSSLLSLEVLMEIERSSSDESYKEKRRNGYGWKNIIRNMKMPEDRIDLSCYERFSKQKIYAEAFTLICTMSDFNNSLDNILELYPNVRSSELSIYYAKIQQDLRGLYDQLDELEKNIIESISGESMDPELWLETKTLSPSSEFVLEFLKEHTNLICNGLGSHYIGLLDTSLSAFPLYDIKLHPFPGGSFFLECKHFKARWYEKPIVWLKRLKSMMYSLIDRIINRKVIYFKVRWYEKPIVWLKSMMYSLIDRRMWVEDVIFRKRTNGDLAVEVFPDAVDDVIFRRRTRNRGVFPVELCKIVRCWGWAASTTCIDHLDFTVIDCSHDHVVYQIDESKDGIADKGPKLDKDDMSSNDAKVHPIGVLFEDFLNRLSRFGMKQNIFMIEKDPEIDWPKLFDMFFTIDIGAHRRSLISSDEFLEEEKNHFRKK